MQDSNRLSIPEGPRPEQGPPKNNGLPGANADPLASVPPNLKARPRRGRLLKPEDARGLNFTPEQRLMILDTWQRSKLPAGDFAPLVGLSKHTLYAWKKRFDRE